MKRILSVFVIVSFIMISSFSGFAQEAFSGDFLAMQREQIRQIESENPHLAKLTEELFDIQVEIQKIMVDYNKGRLDKSEAKKKMRPLLIREQEIVSDKNFAVEQKLFALFANAHQ
jgi:peptidoglycan hydrolase CwlO-like protein